MRLLADESCDFRIVRALRTAGHDVTAVIEFAPGMDDADVVDLAVWAYSPRRTFERIE
jgi:hypothetical protein